MTKKEKYDAVLNLVKERHAKEQPILIGTTSVENSELISKILKTQGINHSILNAKQHDKEAEIIEDLVGLRPGRTEVRLEKEHIQSRPLVHNYGHGGSGVTLSWGCADEVVELVNGR